MALPYDVFAFSFLQEALAVELGMRVGHYHHNTGSFHYYLEEEPLVRELLGIPAPVVPSAPIMPTEVSPFVAMEQILEYENRIRTALEVGQPTRSVPLPELPAYWIDVALFLAIGLSRAADHEPDSLRSKLSACWSWALADMQPQRVGGCAHDDD